jgi:Zn-dependent protease/CBS domain-containing protein
MRGSIKLFNVFGISINIHITFLLLLLLFVTAGPKWLFLIIAVFTFVTIHELCHSLVARHFKIKVKEITLLPIGGVSSMAKMPEKPIQEFLISIAGPLSNIVIILVFYFPMRHIVGEQALFHKLSTDSWKLTLAYAYWINLILAVFNMLPAFPMDGGRILRAALARKMGYQRGTHVAVTIGHLFALAFAYFGIIKFNLILVAVAVFIYISASAEEVQVDIKETLKKFRVKDILARDFLTIKSDMTLAKVLELIFHSHQEDFPVVDHGTLVGFVTRQDIMKNIHQFGMDKPVKEVMRLKFPKAKETDLLLKSQHAMQESGLKAIPVVRDDKVVGVVTLEDIGRVYAIAAQTV